MRVKYIIFSLFNVIRGAFSFFDFEKQTVASLLLVASLPPKNSYFSEAEKRREAEKQPFVFQSQKRKRHPELR